MKAPRHRVDPEGWRLPIKLDTTSNGEFLPVPLSRANREANHLAHEAAGRNAKRLAMGRRDFLLSSCGAARTLLAFNAANAAAGRTGGFFDLPAVAATEPAAAAAKLETGEFIFDVQGHYVDPTEAWLKVAPESAFTWSPKAARKSPSTKSACHTASTSGPRSCRAGRSSGSPSLARWRRSRNCCSRTSRPALWTARPAR
jgi:hypothetical protein